MAVEYTSALQPLLQRFGTHPNLHLVLFTVDADTFSREIAPLAGFYPSRVRRRALVVPRQPDRDQALSSDRSPRPPGFTKLSGFIDDTRAFCSIPARHDMSRRLDAGFLAGLVAEHRLDLDEAQETLVDLVDDQPRRGVQAVTGRSA